MMSLAVVVFNSQGAAYQGLHLAGLQDLECLELIPLGAQAQLLIRGESERLTPFLQQLSFSDVESVTLVEKWNQKIERAFYSLDHATPKSSMIFIENASLGSLFQAASHGIQNGYEIVDLKIPRGSVKWGLLILTGDCDGKDSLQAFRANGNQVTRVLQPSKTLKTYFDIEA